MTKLSLLRFDSRAELDAALEVRLRAALTGAGPLGGHARRRQHAAARLPRGRAPDRRARRPAARAVQR